MVTPLLGNCNTRNNLEEDFTSIKPGTLGEVVGKPVGYCYVLAIIAEFSLKIIKVLN